VSFLTRRLVGLSTKGGVPLSNRRIARLLASGAAVLSLATGVGVGASVLTSLPASAAVGTLGITGGLLTLTSPVTLTWVATLNGTDQSIVDVTPVDQQLTVSDATGSGAGWHVTTSATTFTNGTHTLPDGGALVVTGSVTSISATTAPTLTCVATCTLPTNSITYPTAITTAATTPTAVTIYNAAAATGVGVVVIGGSTSANPLGWWVKVPSNAFTGAYVSTITQAVVSAP